MQPECMLALKEKNSNEELQTGAKAGYLWLASSYMSPTHIAIYVTLIWHSRILLVVITPQTTHI